MNKAGHYWKKGYGRSLSLPTSQMEPIRQNWGYCTICEKPCRFVAYHSWLRDHYRCLGCGSIPRERALMAVLAERFSNWRDLAIHESSPGLPSSEKLKRECAGYLATHYYPDVALGETRDGFRCEDLERQTFPDASFDLVITQDVMEHVLDPDAAFREIARTLKTGGAHVFTTPVYKHLNTSEVRAIRKDGVAEHLFEPEYHCNPIDSQGSLVTIHYGQDIGERVMRAAGMPTTVYRTLDESLGLLGEFLEVMVSLKPRESNEQGN